MKILRTINRGLTGKNRYNAYVRDDFTADGKEHMHFAYGRYRG